MKDNSHISYIFLSFLISFGCEAAICGKPEKVSIPILTKVVSKDGIPQPNLTVSCRDKGILSVSDINGRISFVLDTIKKAGCRMDCATLTFSKLTTKAHESWYAKVTTLNSFGYTLGQPYIKALISNGRKHGLFQEWCVDENMMAYNQVKISGNYTNDKKNGIWFEWYCNGNLKSLVNYSDEKKDGLWLQWHENGIFKSQVEYVKDVANGKLFYWYSNGNPARESTMKNGNWDNDRSITYSYEGEITFHYANSIYEAKVVDLLSPDK